MVKFKFRRGRGISKPSNANNAFPRKLKLLWMMFTTAIIFQIAYATKKLSLSAQGQLYAIVAKENNSPAEISGSNVAADNNSIADPTTSAPAPHNESISSKDNVTDTTATTSVAFKSNGEENPKTSFPEHNTTDLHNASGPGWLHSPSDITIVMGKARSDRLGGQMARVITLAAYAHCRKYNFCVDSKAGQMGTEELGIPVCPEYQWKDRHEHKFFDFDQFDHSQPLAPGFYNYTGGDNIDNGLLFMKHVEQFAQCKNDEEVREYWRKNILSSPERGTFQQSDTVKENLFKAGNVTTIAVHVRRGDINFETRRDVFTKDVVYIRAITQIRDMVTARASEGLGRPEVHLFSEDYGTVNWTSYEGLVDVWHLAPFMGPPKGDGQIQMDWALNIRDWIHFIKADITFATGAFSTFPSQFKADPDPKTGLPLFLEVCRASNRFCKKVKGPKVAWIPGKIFDPNANDLQVLLKNLPDAWNLDINPVDKSSSVHNHTNSNFIVLAYMDSKKEREYIQQIQSLPPIPSGNKFVISYGLYGDNPKYITGAIRNVELAPTYFPGWEMRFYVDDTVPSDAIKRLKDLGGNVIMRPDNMKDGASIGMFWRFLVSDDESIDRFIVRDSDSRLNARDRFAVEEWIQSDNKSTHMVRDHPNHPYGMNGGSWGGTKGFLKGKKVTSLVEEFMAEIEDSKEIGFGADIGFLMKKVWPIVSNDIMSHDSFYCVKYSGKAYPIKRDDNWQHVGQVFDANDHPIYNHMRKLKNGNPEECRPADHKDWVYG